MPDRGDRVQGHWGKKLSSRDLERIASERENKKKIEEAQRRETDQAQRREIAKAKQKKTELGKLKLKYQHFEKQIEDLTAIYWTSLREYESAKQSLALSQAGATRILERTVYVEDDNNPHVRDAVLKNLKERETEEEEANESWIEAHKALKQAYERLYTARERPFFSTASLHCTQVDFGLSNDEAEELINKEVRDNAELALKDFDSSLQQAGLLDSKEEARRAVVGPAASTTSTQDPPEPLEGTNLTAPQPHPLHFSKGGEPEAQLSPSREQVQQVGFTFTPPLQPAVAAKERVRRMGGPNPFFNNVNTAFETFLTNLNKGLEASDAKDAQKFYEANPPRENPDTRDVNVTFRNDDEAVEYMLMLAKAVPNFVATDSKGRVVEAVGGILQGPMVDAYNMERQKAEESRRPVLDKGGSSRRPPLAHHAEATKLATESSDTTRHFRQALDFQRRAHTAQHNGCERRKQGGATPKKQDRFLGSERLLSQQAPDPDQVAMYMEHPDGKKRFLINSYGNVIGAQYRSKNYTNWGDIKQVDDEKRKIFKKSLGRGQTKYRLSDPDNKLSFVPFKFDERQSIINADCILEGKPCEGNWKALPSQAKPEYHQLAKFLRRLSYQVKSNLDDQRPFIERTPGRFSHDHK